MTMIFFESQLVNLAGCSRVEIVTAVDRQYFPLLDAWPADVGDAMRKAIKQWRAVNPDVTVRAVTSACEQDRGGWSCIVIVHFMPAELQANDGSPVDDAPPSPAGEPDLTARAMAACRGCGA